MMRMFEIGFPGSCEEMIMNILTFDIGGTYIKYALMNEKSEFLFKDRVETPQSSRAELIDTLVDVYGKYDEINGIAISMPGIIDRKNGYCRIGGALTYNNDFFLRDALHEKCPVPTVMENDAKCAAMAEASFGALKDVNDGFVLIFGTMIGGGYICNRRLVRGKHFSAGEVSYITSSRDGWPYREEVFGIRCGMPMLRRMYAEEKHLDPDKVHGRTVFSAINAGDPQAVEILNRYCHEIALHIFNIQTILDPERFAIGGGISEEPVFMETLRKHLNEIYEKCPYSIPHAEVVTCAFNNDANLIGALSCWLEDNCKSFC